MYLQSVKIKKFRSIEKDNLLNCGSFNVLIGKNNSGKSNILSAIDAFFRCLKDGQVLILDPPIGKEIDFFQKEVRLPIIITLSFSLSSEEKSILVEDIITDSPQMRNALEGLDEELSLVATLKVQASPKLCAYISSLSLKSKSESSDSERNIFSVDEDAATELFNRASSSKTALEESNSLSEQLNRIDKDDWQRYKSPDVRRYYLGGSRSRKIESAIDESETYAEFRADVQSLITKLRDDSDSVLQTPLKNKVGTFSGEESSIPNYVQNLLKKISEMRVFYVKERRKIIGREEAQQILSLKVQRGGTEKLSTIQANVSDLLGVKIDAFQSSSLVKGESIAELDVDNFLVEVNGSGVREALRLILDVEFEQPNVLLVEEPEVHLHPALETSMMRYLKRISSQVQVFITTHSTNFLDTGEMKNVYLISKNGSTKVQQLNLEEAETEIPKELGIRLSSLFMYDRLVFVEGPSDEAIIREWASLMKINFGQANVGFVSMGGVRNFTHYATESTLSFLTKRQVKMWFLIDKDERNDAEVVALQEKLKEKAVVKVLEKREVENYLIISRAIKEFIKFKKYSAGESGELEIKESDITKAIEECAEQLKQLSIDKRVSKILCKPIYLPQDKIFDNDDTLPTSSKILQEIEKVMQRLEENRNKVEEVYKVEEEKLSEIWDAQKLSLVPGDLLLDSVCQRFGVRFKKERDSARLASFMKEQEIDPEIKTIIQEISKITH